MKRINFFNTDNSFCKGIFAKFGQLIYAELIFKNSTVITDSGYFYRFPENYKSLIYKIIIGNFINKTTGLVEKLDYALDRDGLRLHTPNAKNYYPTKLYI